MVVANYKILFCLQLMDGKKVVLSTDLIVLPIFASKACIFPSLLNNLNLRTQMCELVHGCDDGCFPCASALGSWMHRSWLEGGRLE